MPDETPLAPTRREQARRALLRGLLWFAYASMVAYALATIGVSYYAMWRHG